MMITTYGVVPLKTKYLYYYIAFGLFFSFCFTKLGISFFLLCKLVCPVFVGGFFKITMGRCIMLKLTWGWLMSSLETAKKIEVFKCVKNKELVVSHCRLAIYMKKYLKAKRRIMEWKLKYFTMQKCNLQKSALKETKILQDIIITL